MKQFLVDVFSGSANQMDFMIRLLVSIGIGFLTGLERQHSSMIRKEESFAGIRTFIFLAVYGYIGGFCFDLFGSWVFIAILLSVLTLIGISYKISSAKGDIGGTTEFAALIVFILGAVTYKGFIAFSLVITVLVMVTLSAKIRLHSLIGRLTQTEMYAIIQFTATAILILPFLPDAEFGPYNVLNPREIGWVVILTSGLGFLGYMLIKYLGSGKGILVTGILGGMVSSTMTTWIFAEKSKTNPGLSLNCTTAIMAASSVMVLRVLLWVYLFNRSLLTSVLLPVGITFISSAAVVFYMYRKQNKAIAIADLTDAGKPLHLQSALLFGILYTLILLLVSYSSEVFGDSGIYISGAIAGLSDIDAITISVSKLSGVNLFGLVPVNAIMIATLSNTLVKIAIALWAGSKDMRKPVITGYLIIFASAIISLVAINL